MHWILPKTRYRQNDPNVLPGKDQLNKQPSMLFLPRHDSSSGGGYQWTNDERTSQRTTGEDFDSLLEACCLALLLSTEWLSDRKSTGPWRECRERKWAGKWGPSKTRERTAGEFQSMLGALATGGVGKCWGSFGEFGDVPKYFDNNKKSSTVKAAISTVCSLSWRGRGYSRCGPQTRHRPDEHETEEVRLVSVRSSGNPLNNLWGIFHIQFVIFMNFDSWPFIVNPDNGRWRNQVVPGNKTHWNIIIGAIDGIWFIKQL